MANFNTFTGRTSVKFMNRCQELRRAILGLSVLDDVPKSVTGLDVGNKWAFLQDVGTTPAGLAEIANAESCTNEAYEEIMGALNRY